jgi:hypothetical protein
MTMPYLLFPPYPSYFRAGAIAAYHRAMPRLSPGDAAPDFTLVDQAGGKFGLKASLKSRKAPHLVYFYP